MDKHLLFYLGSLNHLHTDVISPQMLLVYPPCILDCSWQKKNMWYVLTQCLAVVWYLDWFIDKVNEEKWHKSMVSVSFFHSSDILTRLTSHIFMPFSSICTYIFFLLSQTEMKNEQTPCHYLLLRPFFTMSQDEF